MASRSTLVGLVSAGIWQMDDQCPLCERRKSESSELCEFHGAALKNLEDMYVKWQRGYGEGFSKEAYLAKLDELSETGQAVKDVIRFLRKQGARN